MLKELVPGAAPVAVLWEGSRPGWQAAEAAARARGWKVLSLEARSPGEIEATFRTAADARAGALLVFASVPLFVHAQRVVDLAAKYRLPARYELRRFVEVGGLMSYGSDDNDIWHRAAAYVDKILILGRIVPLHGSPPGTGDTSRRRTSHRGSRAGLLRGTSGPSLAGRFSRVEDRRPGVADVTWD